MESERISYGKHGSGALLAAAFLLGQVACSDVTAPERIACDQLLLQADSAWAVAAAGDTITATTGLQHIELAPGTGAVAQLGTLAEVHYTGYLTTGQIFESSCVAGGTFHVHLGGGGTIPGFENGIVGMQVDGVRRLIIPPDLAYGNETLIFDVQLVSVTGSAMSRAPVSERVASWLDGAVAIRRAPTPEVAG